MLSAGLQSAGRGSVHGSRRRILPGALVVVQIALSLLLVAGAGLMIRTVWNLERVTLGFNAANLLLFRIDPSLNGYDGQRTIDLYSRVLERVRSAPGVTAASLSSHKLISNSATIGIASRADEVAPKPGSAELMSYAKTHTAWHLAVDERFFETLGIKFVRGRTFAAADEGGAPVAVINKVARTTAVSDRRCRRARIRVRVTEAIASADSRHRHRRRRAVHRRCATTCDRRHTCSTVSSPR